MEDVIMHERIYCSASSETNEPLFPIEATENVKGKPKLEMCKSSHLTEHPQVHPIGAFFQIAWRGLMDNKMSTFTHNGYLFLHENVISTWL
jgi:hypothetical protein